MIKVSDKGLEDAQKRLYGCKYGAERAVKDALYRAGTGLKTDAVSETKKRYHLSAARIREALLFKKGGGGAGLHSVTLTARGGRKPITDYKVTGRGEAIQAAVKTDGMKTLKSGFLADKDGKKVVLWRPQGHAGPVRAVMSPAVPQAVKNKDTAAAVEKGARERFAKRLDDNINRMLKGSWKG
ncbi:MAG: hypothetical protein LBC93_08290 [Synergistaceae bacterium]|jgi:hypothetical protein|nr:hypothetical protein [Synergistaceae bacterium]